MTNPFGSPEDVPQELRDSFEQMLASAHRQHMIGHAVDQYVEAFSACMKQEGVCLEASIQMNREVIQRDVELTPEDLDGNELRLEAFEDAARQMRLALLEARTLVMLDDTGLREPRPYDAKRHMESRAKQSDRDQFLAAIGKHFRGPQE